MPAKQEEEEQDSQQESEGMQADDEDNALIETERAPNATEKRNAEL